MPPMNSETGLPAFRFVGDPSRLQRFEASDCIPRPLATRPRDQGGCHKVARGRFLRPDRLGPPSAGARATLAFLAVPG